MHFPWSATPPSQLTLQQTPYPGSSLEHHAPSLLSFRLHCQSQPCTVPPLLAPTPVTALLLIAPRRRPCMSPLPYIYTPPGLEHKIPEKYVPNRAMHCRTPLARPTVLYTGTPCPKCPLLALHKAPARAKHTDQPTERFVPQDVVSLTWHGAHGGRW